MKFILFAITLAAAITAAHAQRYAVDWYRVADGGGTSTNTQFVVSGTIAQWDAGGPMTSGRYTVTGGFWQLPGGPLLSISYVSPNQLLISWPVPALGCFSLQQTGNLTTQNWVDVPNVVTSANGSNQVTVTISPNAQFFRLISPCE